jgi:3-oxoacyl-[acyl-carrier protein] reductase
MSTAEPRSHVALVTGANHGIGAATAAALASQGASVLLTYLRVQAADDMPEAYRHARMSDGHQTAETLRGRSGQVIAVEADLTDPDTPARLFDVAERNFGPVDILINNASGWLADTFSDSETDLGGYRTERMSASTFDRQFAVDARGAALLISEFARRHIARDRTWGRIVSVSSGGPAGFPGEVSYGAAKAALENYTMSAALELASVGVTANVVRPPVTDTGWITDKVRSYMESRPDLIHIATPAEVARAIVYLASEDARLITGNVIQLR